MAALWYTIFSILDLLLQFIAAFFAYQIYTFNKLSKAWLAVPLGFLLMALRRVFIFAYAEGYISSVSPLVDSLIIPFIVSLMLVFGIWAMYNNFQKFSLVQSDVEKKVYSFKKSLRKKKKR